MGCDGSSILTVMVSSLSNHEGCDPIEDREDGKVFLCARFHLGTVKNGLAVLPVGHLFLGEGGTKDVLG